MADTVELRGPCPREIVDVLDAIAHARRTSRMQVVIDILGKYTDEQRHISTYVHRVERGNGRGQEG